jgi:hypothetical protein
MSRIRLRKIGSLLALLAILMSVLAPAVSQTLAAHHRLGASDVLATMCTVEHGAGDHTPNPSDHTDAQHWQACAYCGLLAHVPVVPGASIPLPAALAAAPSRVVLASRIVPAFIDYPAAQPRAPPAFS